MREMRMLHEAQVSFKPGYNLEDLEQVKSSSDAEKFLRSIWEDDIMYRERMYILLLNNANKVIGFNLVSIGGMTGTVVDTRIIFQCALLTHATSIILAHNHPSGTLFPSQLDLSLTKRLVSAGEILGIQVSDHLILTQSRFYSFAEHGLINN